LQAEAIFDLSSVIHSLPALLNAWRNINDRMEENNMENKMAGKIGSLVLLLLRTT